MSIDQIFMWPKLSIKKKVPENWVLTDVCDSKWESSTAHTKKLV